HDRALGCNYTRDAEQNGENGKLLHNPIFFIVNQFVPNGQYTKKVEPLIRQHPRSRVWTP
ncbi:MAG: hypothetical protein IKQ52_09905, partial [Bacteroidales bacterium]|nr:hypothetical protein [Bacteroidales bacterium]